MSKPNVLGKKKKKANKQTKNKKKNNNIQSVQEMEDFDIIDDDIVFLKMTYSLRFVYFFQKEHVVDSFGKEYRKLMQNINVLQEWLQLRVKSFRGTEREGMRNKQWHDTTARLQ